MAQRLLILGGTDFVGRHLTEAALARGVQVTLFHRGRTGAELFPEVERRLGDRGGDLAALDGGTWDAVVDTCGYDPDGVWRSARSLAGRVGCYAFVSTISVYADPARPGTDESSPVHPPDETPPLHSDRLGVPIVSGLAPADEQRILRRLHSQGGA